MSAAENLVHGIDVVALVKYLRTLDTPHSQRQAIEWELSRIRSEDCRDEVKAAARAEWKRTQQ